MTGRPFRIGLIGLGGVALAQMEGFRLLDGLQIAAVCDIRPGVAAARAASLGDTTAFTDPVEMARHGELDLLMVMTPAATHRRIVEAIAPFGRDIFCEKPLAPTLADGSAIVEACAAAGVRLFYGSCFRYLPAVAEAYRLIRSGAIGDILLMTEQVIGGRGFDAYTELGPVHYPADGIGGSGMGLVDHGIHLIDLFNWFTGQQPHHCEGRIQISGAPPVTEYATLHYPGGAIGQLTYSSATFATSLPAEGLFSQGQGWRSDGSISQPGGWESPAGSIQIHGTRGALRIFHYANALFQSDVSGLRQLPLHGRPAFGHFATQLEACIAAIREGTPPAISGEDGLNALQVLSRIQARQSDSVTESNRT